MFDDEFDVFYDLDDFAVACTRTRPGEDDATFAGILSTVDESLFEGHVTAGMHVLQYPTSAADLQPNDVVQTVATDELGVAQPAQQWTVMRSPRRIIDGRESEVYLKPAPEV